MRAAAALAALAIACGPAVEPSSSSSGGGGGRPAAVAVIGDGPVSLGPIVEVLGETLPPGSLVAVIAGGQVVRELAPISGPVVVAPAGGGSLAASLRAALALFEGSELAERAVIAVSDGAAAGAPVAADVERMRRGGVLGYAILVGDPAAPGAAALEQLGYTLSRQVGDDGAARGAAGAIGAALGSR